MVIKSCQIGCILKTYLHNTMIYFFLFNYLFTISEDLPERTVSFTGNLLFKVFSRLFNETLFKKLRKHEEKSISGEVSSPEGNSCYKLICNFISFFKGTVKEK